MISREVDVLARDLVRLLGDMAGLHAELAMHMRNKLDAVRHADAGRIQSITARESVLAAKTAEREGLRRQITARILAGLGRTDRAAVDQVTLSELAEMLSEPRRSQLLVAAAGLREKLREMQHIQMTMSLVTTQMLEHLNEVLKVMSAGLGSDVYSRTGRRQNAGAAAVFEAVG